MPRKQYFRLTEFAKVPKVGHKDAQYACMCLHVETRYKENQSNNPAIAVSALIFAGHTDQKHRQ